MGSSNSGQLRLMILAPTLFIAGMLALLSPAVAMPTPPIGKPAPDFSARGMDGKMHNLHDYRGSIVVLEWMSPVCELPPSSMKLATCSGFKGSLLSTGSSG